MESEGPDTSPAVSVASPEAVRNAAREAALQRSQQASLPSKQQLLDRQRLDETEHQLSKLLFSTVMDYRHAAPADVHSCVQILHKLLSNVLHHPDDAALRQVRATSKAFLRLQAINGSDSFLRESGWRSRTVDFKPFWIYECRPATLQWGVLERAVKLLGKAEAVSHDKLERLQAEESERREKKLATSAERQRVLAQFKDDHLLRS